MRPDRLAGMLGLCVRAGQATFGEDGCMKRIRAGQCGVMLVAAEASEATKEKYRGACKHAGTPVFWLPEGLIQTATGRPGVAMAVRKGGLADQLIVLMNIDEDQTNESSVNNRGGASV